MSGDALKGIFAAETDQHAVALAVRMGRNLLAFSNDPVREAKLLLTKVTGKDLHNLTQADFDAATMDHYINLCERRRAREPMSHLLGRRAFWRHDFAITADVLDPRPETETLVQAALEVPFTRVLDLGTGSGCILISILAERAEASGCGVDMSEKALDVAARNAAAIGVDARCTFGMSDWLASVEWAFDLIVSNPPYIAADEMAGLAPELAHEPRMALTDDADGLTCYRIIAAGAPAHLTPGGWLMVEIGPTQGAAVKGMFGQAGLSQVGILADLDGRDRVVVGQKPL